MDTYGFGNNNTTAKSAEAVTFLIRGMSVKEFVARYMNQEEPPTIDGRVLKTTIEDGSEVKQIES